MAAFRASPTVIYPNFRRRQSGVSSTVFSLAPALSERGVSLHVLGAGLPKGLKSISLLTALDILFTGTGPRPIWHARRNIEMLAGLVLRALGGRHHLVFTSAAQRHHTAYTRRLMQGMDAIVATSRRSASFLSLPATIIGHGVDTTRFAPADQRPLRESLGLDPEALYIGCFGALRASKGTDLFVEALLSLLPARPRWQALIVGHAEPRDRAFVDALKARLDDAGLSERVTFTGHVPDAAPYLRAVDLCVAASRTEGFGLTPLEAMASGIPVVASGAGSFPDLIRPGVTGSLFETGNSAALAAALAPLLDDDARRRAMGAAGVAHVRASHSIALEAEALRALYCQLGTVAQSVFPARA